jgi:hypothetical protein
MSRAPCAPAPRSVPTDWSAGPDRAPRGPARSSRPWRRPSPRSTWSPSGWRRWRRWTCGGWRTSPGCCAAPGRAATWCCRRPGSLARSCPGPSTCSSRPPEVGGGRRELRAAQPEAAERRLMEGAARRAGRPQLARLPRRPGDGDRRRARRPDRGRGAVPRRGGRLAGLRADPVRRCVHAPWSLALCGGRDAAGGGADGARAGGGSRERATSANPPPMPGGEP